MNALQYVKEALSPGGTEQRFKNWIAVSALLEICAIQVAGSLSSDGLTTGYLITLNLIMALFAASLLLLQQKKWQLPLAYAGMVVFISYSFTCIMLGFIPTVTVLFILNWSTCLLIGERREYFNFLCVNSGLFFVALLTIIAVSQDSLSTLTVKSCILAPAVSLICINFYLLHIDFKIDHNFYTLTRQNLKNMDEMNRKFSKMLSMNEPIDKILQMVCQECIPLLDLEDCVIYLYDQGKDRLIQKSAFGEKLDDTLQIVSPLEITPNRGVVGKCYATGQTILIEELATYEDYIVDDKIRKSELAVPIFSNEVVIGVIDSEHSVKGFFRDRHVQYFQIIAHFLGIKLTDEAAKKSIAIAESAKEEAENLRQLDEIKNTFITNVTHDLKTPLSLIKGPTLQIRQSTADPQVQNLSNYILKNTDHLLKVVNQLLQLNRVDKGLNQLYLQNIEIKSCMHKIVEHYEGLTRQRNIQIQLDLTTIEWTTDIFRFEQIIHNLLQNAIRYTKDHTTISIHSQVKKESLCFTIIDQGIGIAPNLKDKIFDRFFKADINNHEGTGIGLSIVKEYVKSLNGMIQLESEPGKGTMITLTFSPLNQLNIPSQDTHQPYDFYLEQKNDQPALLVVEDHIDLNNFICSQFENSFQCIQAFDGQEALNIIQTQQPDLIISDLMMPNMDGADLVNALKTDDKYSHIPIIMLTADQHSNSKIKFYEEGVEHYITKPFEIEELKAIVQNIVDKQKLIRKRIRENYLHYWENQENQIPLNTDEDPLNEIIALINQHLDSPELSVQYLCQLCGMGRNKLQKMIKDKMGVTPVEFIRSIRLNEALRLLNSGELNVSEVAFQVGFNNLSYFSRSFKAEFGYLPTACSKVN